MSVEDLISGLALDRFDDSAPAIQTNETRSEVKALVLTFCYGRGKSKAAISVPQLPQGVPTRVIIPEADLRQLLPTRKRTGRGRARVLSQHADDLLEQPERTPVLRPPVRSVQQKRSLFDLPMGDPVCQAVNPGDEYYLSDDEDEGYVGVLLPSQRGIKSHPFGKPPKRKDPFNMTSTDDFPTLGTSAPESFFPNTNNSAGSARIFPPLPPRLSKKVTNVDIVFKTMKEKKSKKKRKCSDSTVPSQRTRSESESVVEGAGEQDGDGQDDSSVDVNDIGDQNVEMPDNELRDPPEFPPLDIVTTSGELWQTVGSHVIQIDGLPEDISGMEEIISSYGKVLQFEKKTLTSGKSSVRVQYAEADGAEYAISCMHGVEGFLTEATLQCYEVLEH